MERTKTSRETAINLCLEWHRRAIREHEAAKSSADMRDFEVAQALQENRLKVSEVAAAFGITHQAVYKMLKRGRDFRTPPLPF